MHVEGFTFESDPPIDIPGSAEVLRDLSCAEGTDADEFCGWWEWAVEGITSTLQEACEKSPCNDTSLKDQYGTSASTQDLIDDALDSDGDGHVSESEEPCIDCDDEEEQEGQ